MPLKEWNGKRILDASRKATDAALVKVASMIVGDAQDNAPQFTGTGARSISFTKPRTSGGRRFSEIGFRGGNPTVFRYMMAMERGRAPGKGVPPGALNLWVRRKLGITDPKEIRSVAYLISRNIKRHGIKGRHFMYRAFARFARHLPAQIAKFHNQLLRRIID